MSVNFKMYPKVILKSTIFKIYLITFIICAESKNQNSFTVTTRRDCTSQPSLRFIGHCLKDSMKNTVILNNKADDYFFSKSVFDNQVPTYLFEINEGHHVSDNYQRFQKVYVLNDTHIEKKNTPISSAYVVITNTLELSSILNKLRDSIWWNHQAHYLIVNENSLNSCQMASAILNVAWNFNLLSVVYSCVNSKDQMIFYTFNPFASIAPKPWRKARASQFIDTPWTLFELSSERAFKLFQYDEYLCSENLFFDKVKQLHGYNLKAIVRDYPPLYRYDKAKVGYERFDGMEFQIMSTALKHINATLTVKDSAAEGYIDNHGQPHGWLQDIIAGRVDILMFVHFIRDFWRLQTHSVMTRSLRVVTLKIPLKFTDQLAIVFNSYFFILLLTTSSICIIALKLILKIPTTIASLEFLRIFANNPVLTKPRNSAGKIILIACIVIEFVFSSFILSSFSAIESDTNRFHVIDTADELIMSNLTIYSYKTYKEIISYEELRERLNPIYSLTDCFERLLQGDRIACICQDDYKPYLSIYHKIIHVSKDSLANRFTGFIFAEESSLTYTFHLIFLKLSAGGFIKLIQDRELAHYLRYNFMNQQHSEDSLGVQRFFIPISILMGSWILSILILCMEVVIFKFKLYK